uniref:Uncharacterized protein LOC111101618 n=1 Tax=Crassostrea virginica TaxID=6565 RepID=A0A8B8AEP4_CRAVI|nr:uncharacterized protein LOC111101618 [Crassostrea virginica]
MLAVGMPRGKRILVMVLVLGCLDVFQNKTKGQGNRCDGGNGCCAGYTWNEQLKTCEKCDLGYYGIDCDKPCQYPYYGENCDGSVPAQKKGVTFPLAVGVQTTRTAQRIQSRVIIVLLVDLWNFQFHTKTSTNMDISFKFTNKISILLSP